MNAKNILKKQKITTYIFAAEIIIFAASLFALFLFAYKNFYEIITQSEIIMILRSEVANETIDIAKFNEVIAKIEMKNKQ